MKNIIIFQIKIKIVIKSKIIYLNFSIYIRIDFCYKHKVTIKAEIFNKSIK